ncbi:hypothetical protein FDA94_28775 [Herbidospora galbida]|uniref:Uncharacterized protein n=1 Tax=Herbidospora galbida TaxID=2575442 RepID=A0A4U3MAM8_9ACTN|nr:hypothetical protein [Herbidospora galbida]TKK84626.1 hypothetical protein FDA94_28775 [Herbidospora galbida]
MSKSIEIGTVHITEKYEERERAFQTASWWRDNDVAPQSVALMGEFSGGQLIDWWYTLDTVITADYFASSGFGITLDYDTAQNAGKPNKITHRTYCYILAELLAVKKGELKHGFIVLDPNLKFRISTFEGSGHRMSRLHNPVCMDCAAPIRIATEYERWAGVDRLKNPHAFPAREYMHVTDTDGEPHNGRPTKESWLDYTIPNVQYRLHLVEDGAEIKENQA